MEAAVLSIIEMDKVHKILQLSVWQDHILSNTIQVGMIFMKMGLRVQAIMQWALGAETHTPSLRMMQPLSEIGRVYIM